MSPLYLLLLAAAAALTEERSGDDIRPSIRTRPTVYRVQVQNIYLK
jgi:hypothetical protein